MTRGGNGIRFQGNTSAKYRDNLVLGAITTYQNNARLPPTWSMLVTTRARFAGGAGVAGGV
jgi:hypothetical protein